MYYNLNSCCLTRCMTNSLPHIFFSFPKAPHAAPRITPVEEFDEETTAKGWRILPGEDTNCRELDQLQLELVLPAEKAEKARYRYRWGWWGIVFVCFCSWSRVIEIGYRGDSGDVKNIWMNSISSDSSGFNYFSHHLGWFQVTCMQVASHRGSLASILEEEDPEAKDLEAKDLETNQKEQGWTGAATRQFAHCKW